MTEDEDEAILLLRQANERMRSQVSRSYIVWSVVKALGFIALVVAVITMALVLHKRSPVLAYDRCHDARLDAVIHDVRLSIDGPMTPKLRQQIDRHDDSLQRATQAGRAGACPSLPK